MPRPLPVGDESHRVVLSAWKALWPRQNKDGKVHGSRTAESLSQAG